MQSFEWREVREAVWYSRLGLQALHLHRIIADRKKAPACFKAALGRGEQIGHLFDMNAPRLRATAKRLGVRVVRIERSGTDHQHIDLCGAPLRRALAECTNGGLRADLIAIDEHEDGPAPSHESPD